MNYYYLHGFGSSPDSVKACYFKQQLAKLGINLIVPDLNAGDFSGLTLSRMVEQVTRLMVNDQEVTLIGSSLGGLVSTILAERLAQVKKLILLAPAFNLKDWLPRLVGPENLRQWETTGVVEVYHYSLGSHQNLNYTFVTDLAQFEDRCFRRQLDCCIFHGRNDETVPLAVSTAYAELNQRARLYELESDHSLEDELDFIGQISSEFIRTC